MPFRRRRPIARGRRPARAREWWNFTNVDPTAFTPIAAITMSTSTVGSVYANYILSPEEMTNLYDEPTLVRGMVNANFIFPAGAAVSNFGIFYGLIQLDLQAPGGTLSPSAAALVPRPWFDPTAPWIWTKYCRFNTVTGFTGLEAQAFGWGVETQFKTKRKFENGSGLAIVIEQYASTNGIVISHNVDGRLLFLNS